MFLIVLSLGGWSISDLSVFNNSAVLGLQGYPGVIVRAGVGEGRAASLF
jgi:hypothetical protein